MQQNNTDPLLVVLLDDMVLHTIPRVFSIHHNLQQGQILLDSDIYFFNDLLDQINNCLRNFQYDTKSCTIFCTFAHLIFNVIRLALENEQANNKYSELAVTTDQIEQRVMARSVNKAVPALT